MVKINPAEAASRFGERKMVCLHQSPDAFEREEGRMALVQMVNARPDAQRLQRATPADAQHHLLLQAHLGVAAVKLIGDVLIGRAVLLDVRVEQIERDAALRAPDLRGDLAAGYSTSMINGPPSRSRSRVSGRL